MPALELNQDNFENEVYKSDLPVLVDFWAPWCGPCREVLPIIEELSQELKGKIKVCKINVEDNKKLARQFRVMTIPTILLFNNGEKILEKIYPKTKEEIISMIENI